MNRILKLIVIFCLTFGFLNGISLANSLSDVDGVDFNSYMNTMYCTIKKNWHPTENSDAGKVVVSYKIKRDGTIIEPKVVSSTNKALNQSAIEAIEKSSPLQPLPKKCKKDLIEVSFTFNYNLK
mgnify:FL=1